ncbi:MAG: gamma-glutamylcyclotransferase [Paraclostridium bifermentans]|nr:gamma-glutamylcyclotransferase [Paraclostridium bifermentans]
MKEKIYCAYGSNMNLEQMSHRCPKAKIIGKGKLENYELTFRGVYKGVANIEYCEGAIVPIVLWNITDECENALDVYEGYPSLYIKKEVEVIVDEKAIKAMAYIMNEKFNKMIAVPTEYYFNVIVKGYKDNKIDLGPLQIAYSKCLPEAK